MPPSGKVTSKVWETVWRELENDGWLCVKHGEQQRNHYLLPLGEECRDNVRAGSYVKSITAADGSSRAVYRTRGEVAAHVRLENGDLSAILASSNVSPAVRSRHVPKKHERREPSTATRAPSTHAAQKRELGESSSQPAPATATRSGRTVKQLRPLEAPGANGEAQLMATSDKGSDKGSDRGNDTPRTTVQMRAETVARNSTQPAKKQRPNNDARTAQLLRWTTVDGHAAISTKENGAVRQLP